MKYITWPVTLTTLAMEHLAYAIDDHYGMGYPPSTVDVELRNLQNEIRAMLQKPDEIDDGIDPLLR